MKILLALLALFACASAQAEQLLRFYSWKDYFDPQVLEDFQKTTGIRVEYHPFTTSDELFKALENGEAYDVIVPSHFMLGQLLKEHRLLPLDSSRLPHYQELDPWLLSMLAGLPGANPHSIPYLWGSIGMVINDAKAQATYGSPLPNSWSLLFDDRQAARVESCGLGLIDAPEEVTSLLLNFQGRRIAGSRQIDRALQPLATLMPRLRALDNWEYVDAVAQGRLCLAMAWSGHALRAMQSNPALSYRIPDEGAALYIDTLAIPANAPHPDLAYRFIDYLIAPDNAIRNARATQFYAPLPSQSPAMKAFTADNPEHVLTIEQRRRSYLLESLGNEQKKAIVQAWKTLKAARP
ncbi:extracellular solute-binding protein [Pseudomonas sp. LRF_L74]|uniref:extracellular solute-binding protein n=1 Tax=Pseudomonas sp. LRF_L74 TaxID=3369422 RepID=UPI003F6392EA